MKSLMNYIRKVAIVVVITLGISVVLHAQTPADSPVGFPTGPISGSTSDGAPTVPFDGGMSLIFAASGIAFGMKKVKGLGN